VVRVKCPKCGSVLEAEEAGEKTLKAYCQVCGRVVWACKYCDFTTFSQAGLAGHLKKHRGEALEEVARLSSLIGLDYRSLIGELKGVGRSSADKRLDNRSIIEELTLDNRPVIDLVILLSILDLRKKLERLEARINAVEALLRRAPPPRRAVEKVEPPPRVELVDESLPSYVVGNPWVKVIEGRGSE